MAELIGAARNLVCPFCGSDLLVSMESRPGHGMYDVPGRIECAGNGGTSCYAEWTPDGKHTTGGAQ